MPRACRFLALWWGWGRCQEGVSLFEARCPFFGWREKEIKTTYMFKQKPRGFQKKTRPESGAARLISIHLIVMSHGFRELGTKWSACKEALKKFVCNQEKPSKRARGPTFSPPGPMMETQGLFCSILHLENWFVRVLGCNIDSRGP